MLIPDTLDTAEALIAFMIQVWEPVDWPTYDRFHDARQTALAFGWHPTDTLAEGYRVYERGFERVAIDEDGAGIGYAT